MRTTKTSRPPRNHKKRILERIRQDTPFADLLDIDRIAGFQRGSTRRSFRIVTHDGARYKLRVCGSPHQAKLIADRVKRLSHVFPKLYGIDRQYLLTDFVSGQSLGKQFDRAKTDRVPELSTVFYKLGVLHGQVHQCAWDDTLAEEGHSVKGIDQRIVEIFDQLWQKKIISKSEAYEYRMYYETLRQDYTYTYGLDLRDSNFYNYIEGKDQIYFIDEDGVDSIVGVGLVNVLRQLLWVPGTPLCSYGRQFVEGYKSINKQPLSWPHLLLVSIYDYALTLASCLRKKDHQRLRKYSRLFPNLFRDVSVGHINAKYLYPTQTFVYNYLTHARHHQPLVLTDVAQNLKRFPINCRYLVNSSQIKTLKQRFGPQYGSKMKTFFNELSFPVCYENLIRDQSVLLLHAHFGEVGYKALPLKRRTDLPLITSFYGIDASRFLGRPQWRKRFQGLFEEGDLFLALGTDMANRLCGAGCPPSKVRIQHLGVDVDEISFRKRKPPKKEPTTILFCGRLVEKKGIFDVLDVFAQVAADRSRLQLRIAGAGHLLSRVKEQIGEYGLRDQVVILGEISHQNVLREMDAAHLFMVPSKTASNGDMEGTPTVIMEAQASGLPVISTHHADIPEVVQDGVTGLLAPEGDVVSLKTHLETMLDHPEGWSEMGEAGRAHVATHYNIHKEIKNLEQHYNELLAM